MPARVGPAAFDCPVRIANDAAMQALGSYDGGRMLFLGFGTGLGSAPSTPSSRSSWASSRFATRQ